MEAALQKKELRNQMRQLLKEQFPAGKSRLDERLLDNLRLLLGRIAPQALAGYAAFKEEPVLTPLLNEWLAAGKKLYLPRFMPDCGCYCMAAVADLQRDCVSGKYGIVEPAPELPEEDELMDGTLWLIPGIAFDNNGNRLGRGCGYYDRLLQRHPGGFAAGVCRECQMLPQIPAMDWDIRMDAVVTECGIYMT